jgi:hypothetical protein
MALAVATTLVVLLLLFVPYLWHPYVRIPSSTVKLHLNCVPKDLVVTTGPGLSDPKLVAVDHRGLGGARAITRVVQQTPPTLIEDRTSQFRLPRPNSTAATATVDEQDTFVAVIEFSRSPFVDIRSVEVIPEVGHDGCRRETIAGDALAAAIQQDGKKLLRYRMVQDAISDVVLAFNSTVGNLTLAGMLVYLVWTLTVLGEAFWGRYVRSEDELRQAVEAMRKKLGVERRDFDDRELVRGRAFQAQQRLAMAKVLGPALGFLLTVSSLAAALHPVVQAQQDAFQFISAIQIAILSTLVGLAIRIVAQVAGAWLRGGADRTLVALELRDDA